MGTEVADARLYGTTDRGHKVHRLVSLDQTRAACGVAVSTYKRFRHVELDPHEVWAIGWQPCVNCFPQFPLDVLREMYAAEEHDTEEKSPGWDTNWEKVKKCRVQRGFLSKPNINGGAPSIPPDPCPPCYEMKQTSAQEDR